MDALGFKATVPLTNQQSGGAGRPALRQAATWNTERRADISAGNVSTVRQLSTRSAGPGAHPGKGSRAASMIASPSLRFHSIRIGLVDGAEQGRVRCRQRPQ